MRKTHADPDVNLQISTEKVCFVIIKAREYLAKDEVTEPDPASNPTDDNQRSVLENHRDDPVVEEITALLNAMSLDEQADLVALAWLGRGDAEPEDWDNLRAQALRARNDRIAPYLLGMPLLPDFLAQGLSSLGLSCEGYEINRL